MVSSYIYIGVAVCLLSVIVLGYPHDELRRKRSPQEPIEINSNVFGGGFDGPNRIRPTTRPPAVSTTTQNAVPGDATARTVCEQQCARTTQFDPVCGTDGENYDNMAELRCAQRCGIAVQFNYLGLCPTK